MYANSKIEILKNKILEIPKAIPHEKIDSTKDLYLFFKKLGIMNYINFNSNTMTFKSQYKSYMRFFLSFFSAFSLEVNKQNIIRPENQNNDLPFFQSGDIRARGIFQHFLQYREEGIQLFVNLWKTLSDLIHKFTDLYIKTLETKMQYSTNKIRLSIQKKIVFLMQNLNQNGIISDHQLIYEQIRLHRTRDSLMIKKYEIKDLENNHTIMFFKNHYIKFLIIDKLNIKNNILKQMAKKFGLGHLANWSYINADIIAELIQIRQKQASFLSILDIEDLSFTGLYGRDDAQPNLDNVWHDYSGSLKLSLNFGSLLKIFVNPYKKIYLDNASFLLQNNKKNRAHLKKSILEIDDHMILVQQYEQQVMDSISKEEYKSQIGSTDQISLFKAFENLIESVSTQMNLRIKKIQKNLQLYHDQLTLYILSIFLNHNY